MAKFKVGDIVTSCNGEIKWLVINYMYTTMGFYDMIQVYVNSDFSSKNLGNKSRYLAEQTDELCELVKEDDEI